MLTLLLILLSVICLLQFFHIHSLHRELKGWLCGLNDMRQNPRQKLFARKRGNTAAITFTLNAILEDYQAQLQQLRKADTVNKQLLTNLSHDIRTPLASLLGYLEALQTGTAADPHEYLSISYQKALALKALVDMLFEWSKITSNEQSYHLRLEDINELTREAIIDWLPILKKKQIRLDMDVSESELPVTLDRMAYKRILNNLVQNAVYHGRCSVITIQIIKESGTAALRISNNGSLIPQEKLPYLFDRLYKCDTSRSEPGSGLGLAITRELTLAMGGSIEAESSGTNGTTFTLFFQSELPGKTM